MGGRLRGGSAGGGGLWVGVAGEYLASLFVMVLATFLQVTHNDQMYTMNTLQTGLTVSAYLLHIYLFLSTFKFYLFVFLIFTCITFNTEAIISCIC